MRFGTIESKDYSYGFMYVLHADDDRRYNGNYCKSRVEAMETLFRHVGSCLALTCDIITEEKRHGPQDVA
jgi:hypothetical protein